MVCGRSSASGYRWNSGSLAVAVASRPEARLQAPRSPAPVTCRRSPYWSWRRRTLTAGAGGSSAGRSHEHRDDSGDDRGDADLPPGHAAHLPGRRAGGGQNLRHAQRGLATQRAWHRRRRRLRRDARPAPTPPTQIGDLEVVPRARASNTAVRVFEEMDVDAVLARRPEVALVDELAHTNVPGSRNEKRWQDVEELLAAGIDVISTVNIQHLESLNDVVERITGIRQRETVPDEVVRASRAGRAGRHDPRGAAPAHGPRQHLCRPSRSTPPWPTTSGPGTSALCGSSLCCGWPIRSTPPSRSTGSATASPNRGRPESGWSSP